MHGSVACAAEFVQLPAGPPLRGGQPDLPGVALAGPVDGVGDDRDDGECQPELPRHQDRERHQDDDRDDDPQLPDPHPRVGGQVGQVAPPLSDAGPWLAGLLDRRDHRLPLGLRRVRAGARVGLGGEARGRLGGRLRSGSRPHRTLRGRRPVPQGQVGRLGFGRRGLQAPSPPSPRPRRPQPRLPSPGLPSPGRTPSRPRPAPAGHWRSALAACPGQVRTGASAPLRPLRPLRALQPLQAPGPSVTLAPWARRNGRRAWPFRRTLRRLSLRPCPVVCCPAAIAYRHQRPDDLFLSFGHAIRYHPPPQRNCLRTQRIAPSPRRLCPTPAVFIAGHSV